MDTIEKIDLRDRTLARNASAWVVLDWGGLLDPLADPQNVLNGLGQGTIGTHLAVSDENWGIKEYQRDRSYELDQTGIQQDRILADAKVALGREQLSIRIVTDNYILAVKVFDSKVRILLMGAKEFAAAVEREQLLVAKQRAGLAVDKEVLHQAEVQARIYYEFIARAMVEADIAKGQVDVAKAQVRAIMQAALDLPPKDKISPHTYHYLFGLLAATGLRISEALALQRDDLVEDGLLIRNGKFGKQRLLPLQPSTRQALETYLAIRKTLGAIGDDLFITTRGRAPHQTAVHIVFVRLTRKLGFRGPTGTPGMRLHDLRHSFAVRSLESCPRDREAVAHHMASLSAYLGHADIASTYWYLEATPVLLRDIAAAGERLYLGDAA